MEMGQKEKESFIFWHILYYVKKQKYKINPLKNV